MSAKDSRRLTRSFLAVARLVHEQVKHVTVPEPLSTNQIQALCHIREQPGISPRRIASRLTMTPPSATSLIHGLIRSGLVIQKPNRQDHRACDLVLTAKGKRTLQRRLGVVSRGVENVIRVLSDKERHELIRILEKSVSLHKQR